MISTKKLMCKLKTCLKPEENLKNKSLEQMKRYTIFSDDTQHQNLLFFFRLIYKFNSIPIKIMFIFI